MFVAGFFGDNLRSPFVGSRIAVAVKDLRGVIAQKRIHFVLPITPVSIKKIRDILCKPHNRNPF